MEINVETVEYINPTFKIILTFVLLLLKHGELQKGEVHLVGKAFTRFLVGKNHVDTEWGIIFLLAAT